MQLNKALKKVSVIGAAGKMGKGISACILEAMIKIELQAEENKEPFILQLIDLSLEDLKELKKYLRQELLRFAEKNINQLRAFYQNDSKLISNQEIIQAYLERCLDSVYLSERLESSYQSHLIFEAIVEDVEKKVELFSKIKKNSQVECYFFSNTSSIPLHILDEKSALKGSIVGFHFYNPPVVQKLIELIIPNGCEQSLKLMAEELVKRLNKNFIYSKDVAGFIGNGFFMRELIFSSEKAREYGKHHLDAEGILLIDRLTMNYLLRPMGIFQLIDYVGLDVCQRILKIMQEGFPQESLKDPLIEKMCALKKIGGQTISGAIKDGFFQYEGTDPKAVFSLTENKYLPLEPLRLKILTQFGEKDFPKVTWKMLHGKENQQEIIKTFFFEIKNQHSYLSKLVNEFIKFDQKLSNRLVRDGIARSKEDVDFVLMHGFYHLYGATQSEKF